LVRSFEPINPLRRSENSLKTLRTIRKSRSRIRMMLMLVRPYTRMFAEIGSSFWADNWLARIVKTIARQPTTSMMMRSRRRFLNSRSSR